MCCSQNPLVLDQGSASQIPVVSSQHHCHPRVLAEISLVATKGGECVARGVSGRRVFAKMCVVCSAIIHIFLTRTQFYLSITPTTQREPFLSP